MTLACMCMLFTGVQPVALNLSQSARSRVPLLPYVIPSTLSAQSTAPTVPSRQGIHHSHTAASAVIENNILVCF